VFIEVGLNWVMVFVLNYSLMALWTVHFSDEVFRTVVNFLRFKQGRWKSVNF